MIYVTILILHLVGKKTINLTTSEWLGIITANTLAYGNYFTPLDCD